MNNVIWLLAGLLVGLLNVVSIVRTVGQLQPGGDIRALSAVLGGFIWRTGLSVLLLVFALQRSATAGLLAFAGLWLARWTALLWVTGKGRDSKALRQNAA